jgi:hypothetical protein
MIEGNINKESRVIREKNKVYLFQGKLNPIEFSAYLSAGVKFDVANNIESMTDLTPGALTTLAANAVFDTAPVFDIPRWFGYKGSKPISFTIDCYLKLGHTQSTGPIKIGNIEIATPNIYQSSIVAPLLSLYSMALPSRKMDAVTKSYKTLSSVTGVETLKSLLSILPFVQEENLDNLTNQIYILEVPKAFKAYSKDGMENKIDLMIGSPEDNIHPINFNNVIIKSIQCSWDRLTIDRGYPERLDISINIETLRLATIDMLAEIFGR